MRALVIDEAARTEVRKIIAYAEKPENWYLVGEGGKVALESVPGNSPQHCSTWNTFKCVFSFTKTPKGVFRHLSISVDGPNYPNVYAVYIIATEFGFDGWDGKSDEPPADWLVYMNEHEHCIVVAKRISQ